MELVLSTFALGVGGSETYLLTVAEQLQRLGHQVTVHAMEVNDDGNLAAHRGIRVVRDARRLPRTCDAVLVQDSIVSLFHARRYPKAPQVFVCHSDFFDLQLPPQLPGITQALVVLNERVARRVRSLALNQEIVRLTQPVDIARFAPRGVVGDRPRRVLVISDYAQHERQRMIDEACADVGLECERIGLLTAVNTNPELAMAHADIVVAKGRVIVEAMACGRAAYVCDLNGGDGWVTPERYELLEADNFGGRAGPDVVDGARLRRDLASYRREMGIANRDLAVRNHSAADHAAALVALFERLERPRARPPAPARELERLARAAWAFERRAFHLVRENDALRARLAELDPGFVPGPAGSGVGAYARRRARSLAWLALGRDGAREKLRWRIWRLRQGQPRSTVDDLAGENEILRRRLELVGTERDELARLLADTVADGSLSPRA